VVPGSRDWKEEAVDDVDGPGKSWRKAVVDASKPREADRGGCADARHPVEVLSHDSTQQDDEAWAVAKLAWEVKSAE
jgi:hypothetical protein